jgi:hypothetical protein
MPVIQLARMRSEVQRTRPVEGEETMSKESVVDGQSLMPEWAFLVQFRAGTDVRRGRLEGRVEHVVSGQATRFGSTEELVEFVARVLTSVRSQPLERT